MAYFVEDTFTDTDGVGLASHTGETGATWAKHISYSGGNGLITDENRVRPAFGFGVSVLYASGAPGSADYPVDAQIRVKSVINGYAGVVGRCSTANADFYWAIYNGTAGQWQLWKMVAGGLSSLGTYTQTLTAGNDYALQLDMSGTTIRLLVDGVQRVSATDSAHSAAGKAGVILYAPDSSSNTTLLHINTFTAGVSGGGSSYTPLMGGLTHGILTKGRLIA